jgi:chemotaxis protein CheX
LLSVRNLDETQSAVGRADQCNVTITFDLATLAPVAPEIFDMMLGLPLEQTTMDDIAPTVGQPTMTGLISIVGDWNGAVSLETTVEGARSFAASMFGYDDASEVSVDEIRDAMGEMTNMAGGSVKNLVHGVSALGIPSVTDGIGYTVCIPRTLPIERLAYLSGGAPVVLTVFETI